MTKSERECEKEGEQASLAGEGGELHSHGVLEGNNAGLRGRTQAGHKKAERQTVFIRKSSGNPRVGCGGTGSPQS